MLKDLIEKCFADIKENNDPNEGKRIFGQIWAVLASKKVKFVDSEIFLSWRELSAELAKIYNEWYQKRFTTDAFIKAYNPHMPYGEFSDYDNVIMRIYKSDGCIGIFIVDSPGIVSSRNDVLPYSETDIVTGKQFFYKRYYKNGKIVGEPCRIDEHDYQQLCYSMR